MAFGIASWRGLGVFYTDGMCRGCTIRFRRQWSLPELLDEPSWIPSALRGAVTVAVVIARSGATPRAAARALANAGGSLRAVLEAPSVVVKARRRNGESDRRRTRVVSRMT